MRTTLVFRSTRRWKTGAYCNACIPSRLIVWPEENHWILKGEDSRYWYQEVYAWLKKYLGDATPATD